MIFRRLLIKNSTHNTKRKLIGRNREQQKAALSSPVWNVKSVDIQSQSIQRCVWRCSILQPYLFMFISAKTNFNTATTRFNLTSIRLMFSLAKFD